MRRAAAVAVLAASMVVTSAAGAVPAQEGVRVATYDLGDQVFTPPAPYEGRSELAAVVHHPAKLRGKHPVIVMQHGSWATCADAPAQRRLEAAEDALAEAGEAGDEAEQARQQGIIDEASDRLWAWPCSPGVDALPSSSGYDYLARALARQGFVVVSTGANGLNATGFGQAGSVYRARAALLNEHLAMWRQLDAGTGPLLGELGTRFRGHLDLRRVGTLGHSMGGGGALQQVSDQRHGEWPDGVEIKAALALAPAAPLDAEPVTEVPFAVLWGTCDQVNTGEYFEWNAGRNRVPIYDFTLTGGNHNYFNTQWSPASGQVASADDAIPGERPGHCVSMDGRNQEHRRLGEATQRRIATGYAVAFFRRHLLDDRSADALLTGARRLPGVPDVVRVESA
ncbi:hypothetical protein SAMN02982929_04095 [Saccharopolyspora kobensis]|uniref:Alpha/beta hydrolase n=1 Tax=Saccharopolyspora kobensis TaxID=146035 RepID=A0A1H6DAV0_9PSEU|nr:hypothetical protein [Saccharopolyspora kobensis]SEG82368.1 hypothetical protein SAMN02982929_04095 [Saccharopolyspora kobensis]SFE24300.1 hypothetical protein SAMN05216506_11012 [Saccharopolyspora kobensis]